MCNNETDEIFEFELGKEVRLAYEKQIERTNEGLHAMRYAAMEYPPTYFDGIINSDDAIFRVKQKAFVKGWVAHAGIVTEFIEAVDMLRCCEKAYVRMRYEGRLNRDVVRKRHESQSKVDELLRQLNKA